MHVVYVLSHHVAIFSNLTPKSHQWGFVALGLVCATRGHKSIPHYVEFSFKWYDCVVARNFHRKKKKVSILRIYIFFLCLQGSENLLLGGWTLMPWKKKLSLLLHTNAL